MERKVSVVDVSVNQKKLQVEIPAQNVQQGMDRKYRDLSKRVRLKGFRPGKIPLSILKTYYGKAVESELSNELIQETFPSALTEAELEPLAEADISEMQFEENGSFSYTAIVDVCPPFQVENYKGLEIARQNVQVSDERVQEELDRIREQHAQLRAPEEERAIREGDNVVIDVTPWTGDEIYEKGKATDYMMEVGKNVMHPDFDSHILGHNVGDALSFEVEYTEDGPVPELAGKRVRFEVKIKDLKEKILPDLDDDFAKELGKHETILALKEDVRDQLEKREQERAKWETRQQLKEKVLEKVQFELSSKVVDREVDAMINQLRYQFESQGLKIDSSAFNTPEIRAEYRVQAEKNLRWRLIAREIAKQENMELTDDDLNEIYKEIARLTRKDEATVRREYADSSFVEQLKDSKIQERVLKFLEDEATYVNASHEPAHHGQE